MKQAYHRFLIKNRNKGIPNLMLILGLANAFVYLFTLFTQNYDVYKLLCFDYDMIFRGQIWRAVTWLITFGVEGYMGGAMGLIYICFYVLFTRWLGQLLESVWGTLRLNIYYFGGALLFLAGGFLCYGTLGIYVVPSAFYLNLSLLLAVATLIPEERILLFGVIPLKMRWLAWLDFGLILLDVLSVIGEIGTDFLWVILLTFLLYPILSIVNYLLTFGKEARVLLPPAWDPQHIKRRQKFQKAVRSDPHWADQYRSKSDPQRTHRHKCTVCGRTDVDSPGLEFRYCSRCKGFYCYCIDHINNHAHIE